MRGPRIERASMRGRGDAQPKGELLGDMLDKMEMRDVPLSMP